MLSIYKDGPEHQLCYVATTDTVLCLPHMITRLPLQAACGSLMHTETRMCVMMAPAQRAFQPLEGWTGVKHIETGA